MRKTALALAALAWLGAAGRAWAAFEDVGQGARAPGMGNAFTAIADDLYAVYYNPAGLAQIERPELSAAYSRLYMGLSDGSDLGVSQLTYAHPLRNGRWGTLGTAWQRFALNDIYQEQSLYTSWGRRVLRRKSGSALLMGFSAKYLNRSFRQLPEAFNACSQLNCSQGTDPVLSGANSKSAIDADFGLLYRFPKRFQAGLLAQHVMKPDVGFAGPDKLPMNLRFGLGYKSLWMNLAGELRMESSPTGTTDRDIILAAERYFPTLEWGQFGLRGSMGFGSRQWRQITTGFSYRINKIQMDYAFLLPIGAIKGTAGTHRVGLTFHFGAPTSEEQISQDLLLQAKRLREGAKPEYEYESSENKRSLDLTDPRLREVRELVEAGMLRKAHNKLLEVAKKLPSEENLVTLSNRLDLAAYYFPELALTGDAWQVMIATGVHNFLYSRDRSAILQTSYALTLNPDNMKLSNYLTKLEEAVQIKAERLPPGHPRGLIEELLYRVELANNRGEHEQVLTILRDLSEISQDNVTALERAGSAYYILGRFPEALNAWEKALRLEIDPKERTALVEYISRAKEKISLPGGMPGGLPAPVEAVPAEPERPKPVAAPARTAAPQGDMRDVERLYQKGVEHYARGEYLQATAMFMRILQIDPNNAPARKALQRIRSRQ